MIGKVFDAPPRLSQELIDAAKGSAVATISAAMPEPTGRDSLVPQGVLTRFSGEGTVAGPAVTAWSPGGNNTMIRYGMEACGEGDVLVIVTPLLGCAQWGDLATAWSVARGIAGVIVFGSIRDVAEIRASGQSVWGRNVDPRQSAKDAIGYVNGPVDVGGTTINAGDLIVADDDAIQVLGPEQVGPAMDLAAKRVEREQQVLEHVRKGAGASTLMPTVPDAEAAGQTYAEWSTSQVGA